MKLSLTSAKTLGYATLILTALVPLSAAQADTGANDWVAQQIAAAPDGTARALWTAESHTGRGKMALVWTLDSSSHMLTYGPVYGPYSDSNGSWEPKQLVVAPDGTSRLLWANHGVSGTEATIWTINANGVQTGVSPTYGPFTDSGGTWYPEQIAAAEDGTSRLLWRYFGTAGVKAAVWTLNSSSNNTETSVGTVLGPYSNASGSGFPQQIAVASDGTSRLLLDIYGTPNSTTGITSGDTISVASLSAVGVLTSSGTVYGPISGVALADMALNTADNTMRLLWHSTSSSVAGNSAYLTTLNSHGVQTAVGPTYGPYAGWSAVSVASVLDGTARVVWEENAARYRSTGDTAVVWGFNTSDAQSFIGTVYGPYSGWSLGSVSFNSEDGSSRLLWNRTDDAVDLWSVNASGVQSSISPVYGSYTY